MSPRMALAWCIVSEFHMDRSTAVDPEPEPDPEVREEELGWAPCRSTRVAAVSVICMDA
jgi:hypothetical protein